MASLVGTLEGEGIDEYNNVLLEVIEEEYNTDDAFYVLDHLILEEVQIQYLEQTVNKMYARHKKELADLNESLQHAVSKMGVKLYDK